MAKLYQSYFDKIQKAVNLRNSAGSGSSIGSIENQVNAMLHARNFSDLSDNSNTIIKALMLENRNLEPKTELHTLAGLLGISEVRKPYKGDHPDFAHLRNTGSVAYHYIISMFIDVQGSTNFHRKYDLEQIALIIQTIVVAATHTVALFGGHIQRLQYDGVFCYFGGKQIKKEDAISAALNAASFFSYFIKYELKEIFQIEGIEDIYTRVGIDFGNDDEVQWLIFGTENCDELTTNSLHTSLAPKMQSNAKANGIMIGHNVWERIGSNQIFTDLLRTKDGNVDESQRYIYQDQNKKFYYTQHIFEWQSYLSKTFWFITKDDRGNLTIDYTVNSKKNIEEQRRLDRLHQKSAALSSGIASITSAGQIKTNAPGIVVPPNRFYYDSRLEVL